MPLLEIAFDSLCSPNDTSEIFDRNGESFLTHGNASVFVRIFDGIRFKKIERCSRDAQVNKSSEPQSVNAACPMQTGQSETLHVSSGRRVDDALNLALLTRTLHY